MPLFTFLRLSPRTGQGHTHSLMLSCGRQAQLAHQPANALMGPARPPALWATERDGPIMAALQSLFQEEGISGSTYVVRRAGRAGAGHSGGDGECWGRWGHCPAGSRQPCGRGQPASHAARSAFFLAWWCYIPACLPHLPRSKACSCARVGRRRDTSSRPGFRPLRWPNFTAPLHHPSGPALHACAVVREQGQTLITRHTEPPASDPGKYTATALQNSACSGRCKPRCACASTSRVPPGC